MFDEMHLIVILPYCVLLFFDGNTAYLGDKNITKNILLCLLSSII